MAIAEKPKAKGKKLAFRRMKRVNGKLVVIYVDENGKELSSLDGYTLSSADDSQEPDLSDTNAAKPTPVAGSDGANRYHGDGDSGKDPYSPVNDPKRKMGQIGAKDIFNTSGFTTWLMSTPIGQKFIEEQTKQYLKDNPTAVGDTLNQAGSAIGNVASSAASAVGGLFNGDQEPAPATAQDAAAQQAGVQPVGTELISYADDISTRKLPVSEDWMTKVGAALTAIDPSLRIVINSGGQTADHNKETKGKDWVGSHRHDVDESGYAQTADIQLYRGDKRILPGDDKQLSAALVDAFATVGFTGIGVGHNIFHVGMGDPAAWSYDANGNDIPAEPWVQAAYNNGVKRNRAGEGEAMVQQYKQQEQAQQASVQPITPQSPALGGSFMPAPGLSAAVDALRTKTGMPPVDQTTQALGDVQGPFMPADPRSITDTGADHGSMFIDKTQPLNASLMQPQQGIASTVLPMPNKLDPTQHQGNVVPQPMPDQSVATALPSKIGAGPLGTAQAQVPPVNDLSQNPIMRSFLDTINYAEGSPAENQLFGYGEFDPNAGHPNKKVYYNGGNDVSTAAGLFQINVPTYQDYGPKMGINAFDRESQYAIGANIATDRYAKATGGRSLIDDLTTGNEAAVKGAFVNLAGTWSSLPGGKQQNSQLGDLYHKYTANLEENTFKPASDKSMDGMPLNNGLSSKMDNSGTGFAAKIDRGAVSSGTPNVKNTSSSTDSGSLAATQAAKINNSGTGISKSVAKVSPYEGPANQTGKGLMTPPVSKVTNTPSTGVKNTGNNVTQKITGNTGFMSSDKDKDKN